MSHAVTGKPRPEMGASQDGVWGMTDLISRKAAIAAALATMAEAKSFGIPQMAMGASKVADDLRALPAQAPAVKVKPLEWVTGDDPDSFVAGDYEIWADPNGCQLLFWSIIEGKPHGTMAAAQAAAWEHHQARILAAIEPAKGADP